MGRTDTLHPDRSLSPFLTGSSDGLGSWAQKPMGPVKQGDSTSGDV